MAVLNTTPDSFSDGGRYLDDEAIARRIETLLAEGADIIDIGGESTRPGAVAVDAETQIARVSFAVKHAASAGALVSIDTTLPQVAAHALALGAAIVNDVSCLADPELARVTHAASAELVLMHSRGSMAAMAGFSKHPRSAYVDVVEDVKRELLAAADRAVGVGLSREAIFFDPGLGFHKSADCSYELLAGLDRLSELSPLVVGASRKSFLDRDVQAPPAERLGGTIAACLAAHARGARVLRVHDVRAVRQAFAVTAAVAEARHV